jgi:succinoglycan biosynthesis transport protein ExoP
MQISPESNEIGPGNAYTLMTEPQQERQEAPPNLLAALWRYRWAVVLPALLGLVVGFVIYLQMPDVYRSTTRLMVETDQSPALDSVTGALVGGVPSVEIVQSQLFSDQAIRTAYNDARMVPFHADFPGGLAEFANIVVEHEALELEAEVNDLKIAKSVVMLLHFDSQDEELSEAVVKSFSNALQSFYNSKHKSSRGKLLEYMVHATDDLNPAMTDMKERYRNFRTEAPLQWDASGGAINPHREQQAFLLARRAEINEALRQLKTEAAAVNAVTQATEEPEVALAVISHLLEKEIPLAGLSSQRASFGQEDATLGMVGVDRDLVPLMVQKSSMEAEFGSEHPQVRSLEKQIVGLRKELHVIVETQTKRVAELLDASETRKRKSAEAITAIQQGLATQIQMAAAQIKELDAQIAIETTNAAKLSEFEFANADLISEIEQQRSLMDELQDQMARVELTEESSETRVLELTAPTQAYLVSPILYQNLGIGLFLGLLVGAGMAFLLEKNSNTFRDAEEIAEVVGAPVLTHLPFFKGRVRKGKNEVSPFDSFDSHLAVIHSPASVVSEAIRSCRTSIFFETAGIKGGKVIQVTSPLPADGKSTIAGNLACSIAQSGKSTILVDCDLRRPQLTDNFGISDEVGLTDILDGRCELTDATHDTPISTLKVIPSGPIPANPAEALTLPDMSHLLEMLREKYDFVIIDSPPLLLVTDPSILASYVDGVLLAIKVRRKSKPNARESTKILNGVGANILGVVVNNSDESGKSDGYRGHGYYRYGRQASRYRRSGQKSGYYSSNNGRSGEPLAVSGRLDSRGSAGGRTDYGVLSNDLGSPDES